MPFIILDNVSVKLPVYDGSQRSIKRALASFGVGGRITKNSDNRIYVHALDNVTIRLDAGDRVGLIGNNGAGKSTLLRVLAGLCEPTSGHIVMEGQSSALLNLGSVMDLEMSGIENIEHVCALLSVPPGRREAVRREIEEFTELGGFLHLPVRTYSAGMQLRLSFALMTMQETDILLLDEAIGVGDMFFVKKAEARFLAHCSRSSIMVVASHSHQYLANLCDKVIWLHSGRVHRWGPAAEILAEYAEGPLLAATASPCSEPVA